MSIVLLPQSSDFVGSHGCEIIHMVLTLVAKPVSGLARQFFKQPATGISLFQMKEPGLLFWWFCHFRLSGGAKL